MLCASVHNFTGHSVDDEQNIVPGEIHLLRDARTSSNHYECYCGLHFRIPLCRVTELTEYEYRRISDSCKKTAGSAVPPYEGRITRWG
jgi:hypothetical protein